MYIIDDGLKLDAVLDMPASGAEKCPLVIVIHGFTGYKEEDHIVAVSRALNGIGYATLRVDMYGHGHSDGEFRKHTLYKWLTNALTVIDYARSLDFVTDLYLCGHSQGGLTVMLAGGLKHDVIKGLIPLSPACMIPELARKGELLGLQFDPVTEAEGQATLQFRFRTETSVRIEYRLVPRGADGWDFSRAAKLPDRERSGQKRGVVSPGDKDRMIRVSRERLGGDGRALLQIVSFRGLYGQVPIPEATRVIRTGEDD